MPSPFCAVVPIYNEARMLDEAVTSMVGDLRGIGVPFEIVLCENGSTDGTLGLANGLKSRFPELTVEHLDTPDYGLALKHAMSVCRHDSVLIFNLDFWSGTFARAALSQLESSDVVLGSKTMAGSADRRPLLRRMITRSFNGFLQLAFGFRGSDTHGMKAVRRSTGLPIFSECVTDSWILDTEFVLRAERRGLRIVEIPVEVQEVRAPTYSSIARRVPRVLRNLTTLWSALRRLPHAAPAEALASGRPSPTDDPDTAGEAALLRHDRRSV